MTNTALLKQVIEESGMTKVSIAEKLGITREALYKKINGETEFLGSEIMNMRTILRLTKAQQEKIFFCNKE